MCSAQPKMAELLQGLEHFVFLGMIADLFQELNHLFLVLFGERSTPHVGFVLVAAQHFCYDFYGIVFKYYGVIKSGLGPVLEERSTPAALGGYWTDQGGGQHAV